MQFVEFVREYVGSDYLSIAAYFNATLTEMASDCRIDWQKCQSIKYGSSRCEKNSAPIVKGINKNDNGRVYIYAELKTYIQRGETFTYPVICFKSYQNTYNQPGKCFNALTYLYRLFEEHKEKGTLPAPCAIDTVGLEKQRKDDELAQLNIKRKQDFYLKNEPARFSKMTHVSHMISAYLDDKGLQKVAQRFDIRIGRHRDYGYYTCFPVYTPSGQVGGLQRIYHMPPKSWSNNKRQSWGFNPMGCFTVLGGDLQHAEIVYLCEGLATGLAMHLATGRPVVICLMASNLPVVSSHLAEQYPHIKRVHVADNDKHKPKIGNTGVYYCALAVQKYGGWVFVPTPSKGSDACDVYQFDGLEALHKQIHSKEHYFNGQFSTSVAGQFCYLT
ncbi:hypothetical protein [Pseudoalteromonas luteoviolacea]|uniref:hypothetical protein n=1 Tax=Pseudoalteromonas luteoviolacea TaxID=43657 RepID=UPI001B35FE72|nr:hypothetical protein [Pseudoalteromonas luteoviolacea]MBQ4839804.1 hypothetical protein [Pseudoalteromonas luteoviolacea]